MKNRLCCSFVWCALLAAGCGSVENRLLYHPKPAQKDSPQLPSTVRDVELVAEDGTEIHARWCVCPQAKGAILYCPGNAGNLDGRALLVNPLRDALEQSVLIFDYPGFGHSKGGPSEKGCYAAADAAYKWLVNNAKIDPNRIIIYGESLGGGVAVNLASRKPHRALVLARTFASVPDVAQAHFPKLPLRSSMVNRFDSLSIISKCRRPIFIACGEKDQLIPHDHGRKL